jgi:hypothetical protein
MRVLLLTMPGDAVEAGVLAVERSLEEVGHDVETRSGDPGDFGEGAFRGKYVLRGGEAAVLFGEAGAFPAPGFDLVIAVRPAAAAAGVETYRPLGILSRWSPAPNGSEAAAPVVEDGPRLERFREVLDEFILREMGPERFLRDFGWQPELRLRDEELGGLLFVPDTSLLVELDAETCRLVGQAISAGDPSTLARRPDSERLAADLYRVGALAKRRTVEEAPRR